MTEPHKIVLFTHRDGDKLVYWPKPWSGQTLHMKGVEASQENWLEDWKANGMKVRVGDQTVSLTELGYTPDDITFDGPEQ